MSETDGDVRTLIQVAARMIRKSVNSQKVSMVLPSIRPSAPPISHNRANTEYAAFVSMYVYVSSDKNICTVQECCHTKLQYWQNEYSRLRLLKSLALLVLEICLGYAEIYKVQVT